MSRALVLEDFDVATPSLQIIADFDAEGSLAVEDPPTDFDPGPERNRIRRRSLRTRLPRRLGRL